MNKYTPLKIFTATCPACELFHLLVVTLDSCPLDVQTGSGYNGPIAPGDRLEWLADRGAYQPLIVGLSDSFSNCSLRQPGHCCTL